MIDSSAQLVAGQALTLRHLAANDMKNWKNMMSWKTEHWHFGESMTHVSPLELIWFKSNTEKPF